MDENSFYPVKISLFAEDMILYFKDPKKLYPKTPRHHK
jgi:hypothetical protein